MLALASYTIVGVLLLAQDRYKPVDRKVPLDHRWPHVQQLHDIEQSATNLSRFGKLHRKSTSPLKLVS